MNCWLSDKGSSCPETSMPGMPRMPGQLGGALPCASVLGCGSCTCSICAAGWPLPLKMWEPLGTTLAHRIGSPLPMPLLRMAAGGLVLLKLRTGDIAMHWQYTCNTFAIHSAAGGLVRLKLRTGNIAMHSQNTRNPLAIHSDKQTLAVPHIN